jgi:DNA primase
MSDQIVQEIKDRLNIEEVIGGYLNLKKAGPNFKANCPFHNEKTPSFVVTPSRQIWHCFGCGEGGDVFEFVSKYENLSFPEVKKLLADRAGVKLPEYRPEDHQAESEKDLLVRVNAFAAKYNHKLLLEDPRGKSALAYLEKRGLKRTTIDKWQIGFAPNDFHSLEKALAAKKIDVQLSLKAGVLAKNERGQVYDRFRGRITFPISDYFGQTVGFSARILPEFDDGKSGKYLNSPETPIYNKSKILFGLNFAKSAIRKQDEMIFVEGQMDCISLHQAGFENVVASSGTAYTQDYVGLQVAKRLTKNIKFCFDGDSAGLKATQKAYNFYLGQDFKVKIVDLGKAKDADELVRTNPQAFAEALKNSKDYLDFLFDKLAAEYGTETLQAKTQIFSQLLPVMNWLNDPIEIDYYVKEFARKLVVSEGALREKLTGVQKPQNVPKAAVSGAFGIKPKVILWEKELVGGLLNFPDFAQKFLSRVKPEDFPSREIQQLLIPIYDNSSTQIDLKNPLAKEASFVVESMVENAKGDVAQVKRYLEKALAQCELASVKHKQKNLQQQIGQAEISGDAAKVTELNRLFSELSHKRLSLEKVL